VRFMTEQCYEAAETGLCGPAACSDRAAVSGSVPAVQATLSRASNAEQDRLSIAWR
jgi:hypothetical protein